MATKAGTNAAPRTLSPIGMSRWAELQHLIPVSRETWRQLVIAGRAPQPIKLSERCSLYQNAQILLWLEDPVGYRHIEAVAQ